MDKPEGWSRWLSLTDLFKSKSISGMGFYKIKDFNQALLAKQFWHLIQAQTLLAAYVLVKKYVALSSLLLSQCIAYSIYLWTRLTWGRTLLAKGLR